MPTNNIINLLKNDHKEVSGLFKILEKTTAPGKRGKIFPELDQALSTHADFEEKYIYPLLKNSKDSKDMALEAVEEHAQIKRLLAELRDLDASDERWKAKITVLAENVSHHVKEEETDDFPQLKKIAEGDLLIALAEEYEAMRVV